MKFGSVRRTFLALSVGVASLALGFEGVGTAAAQTITSPPREAIAERLATAFPVTPPEQSGGTVILGDVYDITSLNPMLATDNITDAIASLVFERLVDLNPIDGSIVPILADSFQIASDGVTYTFHLNREATWQDGVDVTAEDVVFSYDMMLNPELEIFVQSQLDEAVDSYRLVDADTFEIVSSGPFASFLYDAVEAVPIVPMHVWKDVPAASWSSDPGSTGEDPTRVVGTGPFRFEQRDLAGGTTSFVPNTSYWNETTSQVPVIDRFVFRVLPDDAAATQALIAGEIDILNALPGPQIDAISATPGLTVTTFPTLSFNFYTLNLDPARTQLFLQREVRQALLMALDREAIVASIYSGYGIVPVGTQSPLSQAYAPDRIRTRYPFDPDQARNLLATAGWIDDDGDGIVERAGTPLAFEMIFPDGIESELLAAYFQEAWGEIGVEMTPVIMPFEAMVAEDGPLVTHDFAAIQIGLTGSPDGGQGSLFSCDAYEAGFNLARYCNEAYDAPRGAPAPGTGPGAATRTAPGAAEYRQR